MSEEQLDQRDVDRDELLRLARANCLRVEELGSAHRRTKSARYGSSRFTQPRMGAERGRLGEPRVDVESTESTQALLDPSMPEGAIAVADHQTAGRGRFGRSWDAPPHTALLVSVLLKPPADCEARELSLVAGVAVADTLELATDLSVQIKWPNDVMLRRAKVAGCLAQLREGALVLGIGVNVNQSREQLPERAGSLRTLTGREYDREELLSQLLQDLGVRYSHWLEGGLDAVYDGLAPRDFLCGRRVSVKGTSGTAVKIGRDGRLEIDTDDHGVESVESGEVTYEA